MITLCFDMDGTLADLYGYPEWLAELRGFSATPYRLAEPLWNMAELNEVLEELRNVGVIIDIITWFSKESNRDYDLATRQAKLDWLADYDMPIDHFHGTKYGRTKADCVRKYIGENDEAILIDDNAKIRKGWTLGRTINPQECDLIEVLKELLAELQ